jgi:thioredoxin-related protein
MVYSWSMAHFYPKSSIGLTVFEENFSKDEPIRLLFFTNNTCLPCKKLDSITFKDERIKFKLNTDFVLDHINISTGNHQDEVLRFNINSYPTLLFVDGNNAILDRQVGFIGPDSLLKVMGLVLEGNTVYRRQKLLMEYSDDYIKLIEHCYFLHERREVRKDIVVRTYNSIPKTEYSNEKVKRFLSDFLIYNFDTFIDVDHAAIDFLISNLDKGDTILNGRLIFYLTYSSFKLRNCTDENMALNISNKLRKVNVNRTIALYNIDTLPIGDNISRNNDLLTLSEFYDNKNCDFSEKYISTVNTLFEKIKDSPGELFYFAANLESKEVISRFQKKISKKCQRRYEKLTGDKFSMDSFPYFN